MALDRPQPPFPSYGGSEPFAFVCYAHADIPEVYPTIGRLHGNGFNIWYDEGISPGQQWRDELANAIDGCAIFVIFVSPNTVASPHCRKEINYAIERNKPTLAVHLEKTELPPGLSLAMGDVQALLKFNVPAQDFEVRLEQSLSKFLKSREPRPLAYEPPKGRRRLWPYVTTGLFAAVALLALGYLALKPAPGQTIAVLQFENFSSEPENEYISAGIAEEVINLLQNITSLRVVARTASFYYHGKDVDFTTIAQRLSADKILEGSIRREENRIRIAAQLIDGRTGLHEWSEIFERDISDLMTVQAEIALDVAQAVEAELGTAERAAVERIPTSNGEAWALYLEARNYLRLAATTAELDTARHLFNRAIESDPEFIEAQSGLCEAELRHYQQSLSAADYSRASSICARLANGRQPTTETLIALGTLNRMVGNHTEALDLFDQAISLNPRLEPAYYGRARALEGLGRLTDAEVALRRGIELEPGFWQTYSGYGVFLATTGRTPEAVEQFRQVVALTPDNPQGYGNLGTALFALGEWEEAEAVWRESLALDVTVHGFDNLGTVLYYTGNYSEAQETFKEGTEKFEDNFRLWGKLGAAETVLGNTEAARGAFERAITLAEPLLALNTKDAYVLVHLCVYHARSGNPELGLSLCDQAVTIASEDPDIHYLRAIALELANRFDDADEAVQQALALGYSERIVANDPVFMDR